MNKRFLSLFTQRFGSAVRRAGAAQWRPMSQYHYLADDEIDASIADKSLTFRACLLDTFSKYLVLTIPESSPFLERTSIAQIVQLLVEIGITPKLYKAGGSDSVLVFLSFSEPVKTAEMRECISSFLAASGFTQNEHKLTVHSTEIPFSIPLQPGFSWLNDRLETKLCRDSISLPAATAMFLHDLDAAAVSPETVLDNIKDRSTAAPSVRIAPEAIKAICELAADSELVSIKTPPTQPDDQTSNVDSPFSQLAEESEPELAPNSQHESLDSPTEAVAYLPADQLSIESDVGLQLLLFPVVQEGISGLPKGRTKREKRARSNLPDNSKRSDTEQTLVFSTPLLTELVKNTETKEVTLNTS